ncbi:MAG: DUF58 domain-containing protein [Planctomycetes bacterium]|nr:DUF58 domain-containing protein [Planctomycetota bacterium]
MPIVVPAWRWYVALAAGALLVAFLPRVGFGLDAAFVVLLAVDVLLARRVASPEIDVVVPSRLAHGEEAEIRVRIANRSGRPAELRLALHVPDALSVEASGSVQSVVVGAGERTSIGVLISARERGEHVIASLDVRELCPLRLAWRQTRRPLDRRVEVIPGLREVRAHRLLAMHHQLHQAGFRNARLRGEGGAFESLREYVHGDDPRRLDWKASARHAKLIVRQYEAERNQSIVLCVDTGRLMSERVGDRARLDHALAAAVVLSEVARVWQDQVGVFAFSDEVQAVLPPDRYPPDRIPSVFAKLEARSVEPDYPRALTRLSRLVRRRSLLVFFGDVIDEEVSAPLAVQLARLARRHLPLFVAMRNVDLFAAAAAPCDDRPSAYRRAAATELVLARAHALAKMRDHGIQVLDIAPEAAVAEAVNRYVTIKRRGAL